MTSNALITRFRGIVPSRDLARRCFDDAGLKGYSERRAQTHITMLVVEGAAAVFHRRSSKCMIVVAGDSHAACEAIETRFNGSSLTVEGRVAAASPSLAIATQHLLRGGLDERGARQPESGGRPTRRVHHPAHSS